MSMRIALLEMESYEIVFDCMNYDLPIWSVCCNLLKLKRNEMANEVTD